MKNTTDLRGEQAVRYKMYKAKKQWLVAGAISVALLAGGHITAQAETSAPAESSPPTSQTQSATAAATTETATETPSTDTAASSTGATQEAAPVEKAQTPEVATSTEPSAQQTTQTSQTPVASTATSATPAANNVGQTSSQSSGVAAQSQSSASVEAASKTTTQTTTPAASTGQSTSSQAKSDTKTADEKTDTKNAETKTAKTTEPTEIKLDQSKINTDLNQDTKVASAADLIQADSVTLQSDKNVKADGKAESDSNWDNPGKDIDETKYDKGYILFNEIKDPENALPNIEYGRIFSYESDESGEHTKYFGYNEKDDEFVLLTDSKDIQEIKDAISADVVTTDHLSWDWWAELAAAVAEGKNNLGEYNIIQTDKLPAGLPNWAVYEILGTQNYEHPDTDRTTLPEGSYAISDRLFVKKADGYYWYNKTVNGDSYYSKMDDKDLNQILDGNSFAIRLATTDELEAYDQQPIKDGIYEQYQIIETPVLPDYITDPDNYLTDTIFSPEEFITPDRIPATNGATKQVIYTDGHDYYKAVPNIDNTGYSFEKLADNSIEVSQFEKAEDAKVVVHNSLVSNQLEVLREALRQGQSFIQIGDEIYRVGKVNNLEDLPEVTNADGSVSQVAYVPILVPDAAAKTDQKIPNQTGTDLLTLDTMNPGVSVSLIDYWVEAPDPETGVEDENPDNVADLGINAGHDLKFSAIKLDPADGFWNIYDENKMTQGIVQDTLDANKFPVMAMGDKQESLDYLFNDTDTPDDFKKVYDYNDKAPIFISDGLGNYSFISDTQHADFDIDSGEWIVYNKPNSQNGVLSQGGGQFFPLNTVSDFFHEKASADTGYGDPKPYSSKVDNDMNHYFGMVMDTTYIHPAGGQVTVPDGDGNSTQQDMTFTFSGDDDFWLFIDDKLVLDIGGIHQAITGVINFADDTVKYYYGNTELTDYEHSISEKLNPTNDPNWNPEGKEHTMRMFYLERGNDLSHLRVGFNLQIPEYNYADNLTYGYKPEQTVTTYTYGVSNETLSYKTPDSFAYTQSNQYGVQWTPKDTDPDITDPDITDPDITDPDVTDPDVTDPDVTDPDTTPEEPHTPDVDPDTEVDPVTPAVPEDDAHTPAAPAEPAGAVTQVVAPASEAKATQATPTAAKTPATPDKPEKMASSILPQTGETTDHAGLLGLMMVGLTGLLGLFGLKKKKEQ